MKDQSSLNPKDLLFALKFRETWILAVVCAVVGALIGGFLF